MNEREHLVALERLAGEIEQAKATLDNLYAQRHMWVRLAWESDATMKEISKAAHLSVQRVHQVINR